MMRGFSNRRRSSRLGTTVVETALVLPVFLMIAPESPPARLMDDNA
jgi:Flp pilus assembly protein TadG